MFATLGEARVYALAGKAVVTLKSRRTGKHYTFRVKGKKGQELWFVSVLSGPDNEGDYRYIGVMRTQMLGDKRLVFVHTPKSQVGPEAESFKAWSWFVGVMNEGGEMPDGLEVWHEGRCGRCGRKLTTPESVARGLGPECAERG